MYPVPILSLTSFLSQYLGHLDPALSRHYIFYTIINAVIKIDHLDKKIVLAGVEMIQDSNVMKMFSEVSSERVKKW